MDKLRSPIQALQSFAENQKQRHNSYVTKEAKENHHNNYFTEPRIIAL
jgi:hypothetical protein